MRPDGTWQRYHYDAAGRLAKVFDDSGVTLEEYAYGADGRRLTTTTYADGSSVATHHVWSGSELIAEYTEEESQGVALLRWAGGYVYWGGRLLSTLTPEGGGETVRYHHPDRLGTRLVTDETGTVVAEQVTLPFGTALDAESTGETSRRFTSYDRSAATGLDYAVNRYYDPHQGRFTQVDPLELAVITIGNPQSHNLYSYIQNDPVNATDPMGLLWRTESIYAGGSCTYYGNEDTGYRLAGCTDYYDIYAVWIEEPERDIIGDDPTPRGRVGVSLSGRVDARVGLGVEPLRPPVDVEPFHDLVEGALLLWVNNPVVFAEKILLVGFANAFAQVGATIGEISMIPVRAMPGDLMPGLQGRFLWGITQSGFNRVYDDLWEHFREHDPILGSHGFVPWLTDKLGRGLADEVRLWLETPLSHTTLREHR
jgi:RHS repeat-associated protein